MAQVEVYEVASFYDHFDVVREGDAKPAPTTIRVCDGIACQLAGAEALLAATRTGVDPESVRVVRGPCMGGCDVAPAACVGQREIGHATPETPDRDGARRPFRAPAGSTRGWKPTARAAATTC